MGCVFSRLFRIFIIRESVQENNESSGSEDQPQPGASPSSASPGVPIDEHEEIVITEPATNKDHPQDASPSSTPPEAQTNKCDETVITNIRITDAALGLGRIPSGFYSVVHHNGLEWRTENKGVSVDNDIVEWDMQIPIPSDPSATISLGIYASFELQPMLGCGEQLRKLSITVEQLLEYSAKTLPITFFPGDEDVISPCSSLFVEINKGNSGEGLTSLPVDPHLHSTIEPQDELVDATNKGHSAFSRYRRHGEQQDIERSIEQFERALRLCPPDHPCHAAAQSNLATSKFVYFQIHGSGSSFDVPMSLYHDALNARPAGHLDRPRTLIQLATVHFVRFNKERQEFDAAQVEALLKEAIDLSPSESHEKRAAVFMLHLHAKDRMEYVQMDDGSPPQHNLGPDMDPLDLGRHLLFRFLHSGAIEDIQQAILSLERSVQSSSPGEERYLVGMDDLGIAFINRYLHLGVLSDLENAITRFRNVAELSRNCHHHKPGSLTNLGNALLTRFNRFGEVDDIQDAISSLRDAVEFTPNQHPDKATCLNILGDCLRARFRRLGDVGDLQDAISKHRDAVKLIPDQHPDKPACLCSLGTALRTLFDCLGEVSDLQDAISSLRGAVELIPDQHPNKPVCLCNLGTALRTRFVRLGEVNDIQEAISSLRDAIELTPNQNSKKPGYLNNLGNALRTRFDFLGEVSDLQDAISSFRDAIELMPNRHPDKPEHLYNLGTALRIRFSCLGEISDIQDAISQLKDAIEFIPDGHPEKPVYLSSLGTALRTRFDRLGEVGDLLDAILRHKDAVKLTPDRHPDKPGRLSSLGSSLQTRFNHLGKSRDLRNAISSLRDAVKLTPNQHPEKSHRLNNLGNALRTCFDHFGKVNDLQDAISSLRDAVELMHNQNPDKPTCVTNLGASLYIRFHRLGEVNDLQDAISRHRDAVQLTPSQHPEKPWRLSNLGVALLSRFDHLGDVSDLQDSISRFRDAIELIPNQHPEKPACLNNFGNALQTRFHRLGDVSDLQDAILSLRNAVELSPDQHPDKPARLCNLGTVLLTRFDHSGEVSLDLQDGILSLRGAVKLMPDQHPDKRTCLNNLGTALWVRFKFLGDISDIQDAILYLRDAVELTPNQHSVKPTCLSSLGNALQARFNRLGEVSDLQEAILRHRDAVELIPNEHADKPACLNNLGNSLLTRFERLEEVSDLQDAISAHRDAVEITPDYHSDKPGRLFNLGAALQARFDRLKDVSDLEEAISQYSSSALASIGPAAIRLGACYRWAKCARDLGHSSLLTAYATAISILPQLAWAGLPLTDRYRELIKGAGIVREAAATALDSHLPETAVEWLEQGRSIVWGDLYQLRNSYDELSHLHPNHADRLMQLSGRLEKAGVEHENFMSVSSRQMQHGTDLGRDSLQIQADKHRNIAIERDKLLQEIRRFSGFERFLLQKEYLQLRASAHSGPVVILNAAESRCDALIILTSIEKPIHVSLPQFTLGRSTGLQNTVKELADRCRDVPHEERKGNPKSEWQDHQWKSTLSVLWKNVVKPVLDALSFDSTPGNLSRIFWCPTGPFTFLPIHAAGLYGTQYLEHGHKLSDFVVSSYIPTLSILAPSPEPDTTTREDLRFVAVPQPSSDGQSRLPGVAIELEHIRTVIRNCEPGRISLMESSTGSVEEVLSLMMESDWVHFACHGVQDVRDPTTSGLCLSDGRRLRVSDIVALSRPRGGLAFLSACQTAMGDEKLSDEAIHIAAGMLFAGYRGVVGSMWSISDRAAPTVARDVYEQLFQDGGVPNHRNAARALHNAVVRLRDNGESLSEWLPFIHVGL